MFPNSWNLLKSLGLGLHHISQQSNKSPAPRSRFVGRLATSLDLPPGTPSPPGIHHPNLGIPTGPPPCRKFTPYIGVSKNRSTVPQNGWCIINGKPYFFKWMIWGKTLYFWKHLYKPWNPKLLWKKWFYKINEAIGKGQNIFRGCF